MKMAKALTALILSFGVAQFSCASVAVMDVGNDGGFGGTNSRNGGSISFSNNSLMPVFAIGDVQDRTASNDPTVDDTVDQINSNSLFNSLQSISLHDAISLHDKSNLPFGVGTSHEADSWIMLAVGIGLIGYQLRRKQRSLFRAGLPSMA